MMGEKLFKFTIDKMVLSERWTSLGAYMTPKEIIVSDNINQNFGGYCAYKPFGCSITIRPKYENDKGLIGHEKTHSRQYGRLLWIHSGLTMLSGWYRLLVEIEAYRSQAFEYEYTTKEEYEWMIDVVDGKYNTKVPKEKIRKYMDYAFKDFIKDELK